MSLLKSLALRCLPPPVLHLLKKRRYVRQLRAGVLECEPDMNVVHALVKPGQCAYDVGANIGVYSKLLAGLTGPDGRVVAFEPVPETFDLLVHNLRALGLANVRGEKVALSDSDHTASMSIPSYPGGGENLYEASLSAASDNALRNVKVECRRLDGYGDLPPPDFIKIDVEGHEAAMLEGARACLESSRPVLMIEIWSPLSEPDEAAAKVLGLLSALEYEPWWLDGDVLRRGDQSTAGRNYFFLQAGHLEALRKAGIHLKP